MKKKREKNQINKIRNEKGELQKIIRDYYEQLMAIKWKAWKKWTDS